ncbi:hypothetical protein EDD21DRAFT_381309, partial [Dissophora ornata]
MASERINPLEIFHIVALIGRFVDLWNDLGYQYNYKPTNLLSCAAVSRTWRAALLPILWEVYDGDKMRHIPNEIIIKYSLRFRVVIDLMHPGPLHCAALQFFETSHDNAFAFDFLKQTKPRISTFRFSGTDHRLSIPESDVPEASRGDSLCLADIPTDITGLDLTTWLITDESNFLRFLTRYHSLSTLSLSSVSGFHRFPSAGPLLTETSPPAPVLLHTVKTLHLTFVGGSSHALLEMVKCCPSLERLYIIGSWIPYSEKYKDTPFYRYCPNIESLSIHYRNDVPNQMIFLPRDEDLENLIRSFTGPPGTTGIRGLKTFEAKLVAFFEGAAEALASAAETLEVFNLELESYFDLPDETLAGARAILRTCHKLKSISLKFEDDIDDELTLGMRMVLEEPWACLETLEQLCLSNASWRNEGFHELIDKEAYSSDGRAWVWCVDGPILLPQDEEPLLFGLVKQMPRLWRLVLMSSKIYRIKKY